MGSLARYQRPSRPTRRTALALGLACGLASMWVLGLASAAPASTTVAVPTAIEAWYHAPTATATIGGLGIAVPIAPANPYAEGTLHVGIKAGTEEARTYLRFDASTLAGATPSTTLLVLPVDLDGGTDAPESARLDVCFAPDPGGEADGSLAPPPPADCTLSAPAEYEAEPVPRFVADVSSFAAAALRDGGLAVLPSGAARTNNATWHVAFHGRDTAPSPDLAIHADVEVAATETPPGSVVTPVEPPPPEFSDNRPAFSEIDEITLAPRAQRQPSPLLGDSSQAAMPAARVITSSDAGFAYPAVLALPLALLAVGGVLGSSLGRAPTVSVTRSLVGDDDAG